MYEYKKRESKLKKIISLIFLIIIVSASSIFIYSMYTDIDVYSTVIIMLQLDYHKMKVNKKKKI